MLEISDYLSLNELSKDTGVSKNTLTGFFTYHRLYRHPYRVRRGHQVYVRLDAIERYTEGRAAQRPKGWPTVKRLCLELGLPRGSRLVSRLLQGLRTLQYRHALYVHPDDAQLFRTRILELRPLPGWINIQQAAKRAGRTRPALTSWARNRDIPLREFWASPKPPQLYIHQRDLERYCETRAEL